MRILFLSNFYPPARSYGYTQWCFEVAEALRRCGHAVAILTSRYQAKHAPDDEKNIYRLLYLQTRDLDYYRPPEFFLHHRRQERGNLAALDQVTASFRPDVVFVWGMWNLSRGVPARAELRRHPPVVYYVSDLWPAMPDTHATYWDRPARRRVTRWLKVPLRRLARGLLAREGWPHPLCFDHAICVSHYIKDTLSEAGLPFERATVIHGGTAVERFLGVPRELERKADGAPLELLYAGQLARHKGVHTVVEAMTYLLGKRFPVHARLTLVGSGHPGYAAELQTLVRRAGIEEVVRFHDPVPREQMPQLLSQYDVLLFPSTGPEALPRMVQEGMAAGLVVVGTTTGGTGEILAHDRNGLVFPAGDATGLADRIARVATDPGLRHHLAQAGRQTVLQSFTLEYMVEQIEAYLQEIVRQ